jgi:hypothetical protein
MIVALSFDSGETSDMLVVFDCVQEFLGLVEGAKKDLTCGRISSIM